MSHRDYDLALLGKVLRDLSPIVAAATRALDKPGTRSLRYKLDRDFHFAVGVYGMLCRSEVPEDDWASMELPTYSRVIPLRAGGRRDKIEGQHPEVTEPRSPRGRCIQLLVDNTRSPTRHHLVAGETGGAV